MECHCRLASRQSSSDIKFSAAAQGRRVNNHHLHKTRGSDGAPRNKKLRHGGRGGEPHNSPPRGPGFLGIFFPLPPPFYYRQRSAESPHRVANMRRRLRAPPRKPTTNDAPSTDITTNAPPEAHSGYNLHIGCQVFGDTLKRGPAETRMSFLGMKTEGVGNKG
jgi:hypothetical protein